MTLQGEALFLSHSDESSTHMLQSDTWRVCLNQFQEALPQISVPRPRESEKARQRRLRKAKRKQKNQHRAKVLRGKL